MRTSHTLTRFRGLMSGESVANIPPDAAIDCQNVVGDSGGWLQQLMQPTALIDWQNYAQSPSALDKVMSLGYLPVPSSNPRLLIQQGLHLLFSDHPYHSATPFTYGDLSGLLARIDFALANGILYFSNGQTSGYSIPPSSSVSPTISSSIYKWGIDPPVAPPTFITSTCSVGGSVTLHRVAGVLTVTFASPHGATAGLPFFVDADPSATWVISGHSFPGVYPIDSISSPTVLTILQPDLPDEGPYTRVSVPFGISATTGYQFAVSYGSSPVGHYSSVSSFTPTTGPISSRCLTLLIPPSSDPQVDTSAIFRNLDGGGDFYLTNDSSTTLPGSGTTTALQSGAYAGYYIFLSTTPDATLVESGITAPYDNGTAPLGKYLSVWLDRILMCGISSDPTAVRYTGYDSLSIGRPQMSWCQFNNVRLGQGEAYPMGMGPLRYGGMVFFGTNGLMYIYRGTLNDVTVSTPTPLSFYAERLPYQIGLYSHFTIQSTPAGLVWLDDGFNLRVYENSGFYPPRTLSSNLSGLLRRITPGSQDSISSVYINYLQRDWYAISLSIDGSPVNNCTIIVDLDQNAERNTGAWPTTYSCNSFVWLTYTDGSRHLISTMPTLPSSTDYPVVGFLAEIPIIDNVEQGVHDDRHSMISGVPSNPPMPNSYWRGGYFGIKDSAGEDAFSYMKMMRYCRLTGSLPTSTALAAFLVDTEGSDFDHPRYLPFEMDGPDFAGLNAKARALSVLITFPDPPPSYLTQPPATLTSLMAAWNLTGIR